MLLLTILLEHPFPVGVAAILFTLLAWRWLASYLEAEKPQPKPIVTRCPHDRFRPVLTDAQARHIQESVKRAQRGDAA